MSSEYEEELLEQEDEKLENEDELEQIEAKKNHPVRDFILEVLIYAAIIVVCATFVPEYVIQRTVVDGSSMMNTLKNKDNLLVEKVSYHFADPKRFDVIVFYPYGREDEDYYIKRVIGLPGETVQIIGEDIFINGEKLEEDYGKDPIQEAGIAAQPLTLGEDEFFVLGDNRTVSQDSRYEEVGPVQRKNIDGKAIVRIYPFDKLGNFDK